jgi:hypothetical protein
MFSIGYNIFDTDFCIGTSLNISSAYHGQTQSNYVTTHDWTFKTKLYQERYIHFI